MRKTMFITRPTRDAFTSHGKLIEAMQELEGTKWTGNRQAHQMLEQILVEKKIKAPGGSNDGSGGRTWAALARTFGYWYQDSKSEIVITPVAKAILAGNQEHLHVQKQILNYQIPNGYVLTSGFKTKYAEGYRIFPFRFMLRLLTRPELNYCLHRDEISIFFLPTKTDSELEHVASEILFYRELKKQDGLELNQRVELLNDLAEVNDHRHRSDSSGVNFLAYLTDSALTHMIIIESVNYYWFKRSGGLISLKSEFVPNAIELLDNFDTKYPFSSRFKISEESFARHYGLDLSRAKNTFRYGQGVATRKKKQDSMLRETAEDILRTKPLIDNETLVREVKARFPLGEREIIHSLRQMDLFHNEGAEQLSSQFIDSYLEAATNSNLWSDFEKQSIRLLNAFLDEAFSPPKPHMDKDKANIEIGVRLHTHGMDFGGILDCKSGQKFQLGTRERDLMATSYIPMYKELQCPSGPIIPLRFFGYIIGKDFGGKPNLNMIREKASKYLNAGESVDGFVINARSLLYLADLVLDKLIQPEDLLKIFTANSVFLDPLEIQRFLQK